MRAAFSLNSCRTSFFVPARNEGMMASCAIRSVSRMGILTSNFRTIEERAIFATARISARKRLWAARGLDIRRLELAAFCRFAEIRLAEINPADVAVGATINEVCVAVGYMAKEDDRRITSIKFLHGGRHGHVCDVGEGFSNDGRVGTVQSSISPAAPIGSNCGTVKADSARAIRDADFAAILLPGADGSRCDPQPC